jgi:hypothetical protein
MNYIYYVKQQVKMYTLGAIAMSTAYTITRYFEWREVTTLTPAYIISFSLTYIFLGALFKQYFDSLKQ